MDAVKQLCRLCAESKSSTDMVIEINDPLFGIQQKLVACCRWRHLESLANEYFPENICINCIQKLESCWQFSENVAIAQRKLLDIINNITEDPPDKKYSTENITVECESNSIETVHIKIEIDDNDIDTVDNCDEINAHSEPKILNFELNKKNAKIFPEKSTPIEDKKERDLLNQYTSKATSLALQKPLVQKTRKRKRRDPYTKTLLKRPVDDFLLHIRKEDRLDDGTVDPQRILQLNLQSWLVMQHQCYVCGSCMGDFYELKRHFLEEHPQHQLRHVCCLCLKMNIKHSVKHRHSIHEHVRNFHLTHLKYCCWKCNKFFWDLDKMQKHLSKHKREFVQTLCHTCGKTFDHESALRLHVQSHLPAQLKRAFECYLCSNYTYGSKLALKYHINANHVEYPKFACDTCGRIFKRKDLLKRHYLVHLDIRPHLCMTCGKQFKMKKHLENHTRIHSNERPYHCNYCPYTCTDCGNMLKHIRQKHRLTGSDMKQHYSNKMRVT